MQRRLGVIFADAMVSLALLTLAAGVLALAVNRNHAASQKLSDLRAASRLAESALLAVQSGQPLPAGSLHVQVLQSADSPAGQWVQVIAVSGKESASLIGLAPRAALKGRS